MLTGQHTLTYLARELTSKVFYISMWSFPLTSGFFIWARGVFLLVPNQLLNMSNSCFGPM